MDMLLYRADILCHSVIASTPRGVACHLFAPPPYYGIVENVNLCVTYFCKISMSRVTTLNLNSRPVSSCIRNSLSVLWSMGIVVRTRVIYMYAAVTCINVITVAVVIAAVCVAIGTIDIGTISVIIETMFAVRRSLVQRVMGLGFLKTYDFWKLYWSTIHFLLFSSRSLPSRLLNSWHKNNTLRIL